MVQDFRKRIVVVDDHPMMRKGLAMTLDREHGFEVVAQFEKAEEVLQYQKVVEADLLVIDLSLPGMSGLELIKQLNSLNSELKILVVSCHEEKFYAERVIRAGADGYLMKLEESDVLLKAANKVLKGGVYVSNEVSEKLLEGMARGKKDLSKSPIELLSDRELEVFELTGRGDNTRTIAEKLHIAVKTVESYRARIKNKLNLEDANELLMHAIKWVDDEEHIIE